MRFVIILAAMVFAVSAASVSTQGRGGGQAKKTTVSAPKAKSTQASGQTARQTKKADTRVAKADARAAKTTAKADARAAKTTAKADARATRTTTKTTTRTTTRTETPATKTETRAAKLNPNQEARLMAQLPAGMTVQDAAQGFKNWGQFQAAVNASTNHSISFVELKSKMTGIAPGATEPTMTPMSLGQALQSFGVTDTPTTPTTPTR